ncbi:MAG TPA: TniQ family protein [Nakamurella sp.]
MRHDACATIPTSVPRDCTARWAELGYAGSYSTLTRELRNSGIATTCPACEHRPHGDTYPRTPIRRAPQSLPMRVAPLAGETIASYLGRLAAVNHLPLSLLLTQLPPWFTARTVTHDDLTGAARADAADVESLAALSGLTATTLLHALPGFRSGSGHGRPPVRATHACPRCAARHGHTEPVPVHLSAHQRLCARHRVWLGTTTGVDLVAAPEIIHAQRLASRLARRHTGPRLMLAEATALQQIIANQQDGEQPDLIRPAHHSARLSQPASRVRPPQPDRSSDLPRNDQQRRQRSHPVQLTHGSRPRAPPRHQTAIGPDSLARSTSNTLTGRLRRQPKR